MSSEEQHLKDLVAYHLVELSDDSENSESVEIVGESDSQNSEGLPEVSDSSYDGANSSESEAEEEDYDERKEVTWIMVKEEISDFMRALELRFKPMGKKSMIQKELFYAVVDLYQQH